MNLTIKGRDVTLVFNASHFLAFCEKNKFYQRKKKEMVEILEIIHQEEQINLKKNLAEYKKDSCHSVFLYS